MTTKEALNKIRVMLGVQVGTDSEAVKVEYRQVAELLDGTLVAYEGELGEGTALFVVTEESNIPAPEGVHETKDGKLLTVDNQGIITSVEEVEATEEAPVEEAMSDENGTEFSNELIGAIAELIKPLNAKINAIESKFSSLNSDFNSFKNEPGAAKVKDNTFSSIKDKKDARLEALANLRKK